MRSTWLWVVVFSGFALGGCVAPEQPDPPRVSRSATPAAASTASSGQFEDAPVPDRRIKPGADASVIRLGK